MIIMKLQSVFSAYCAHWLFRKEMLYSMYIHPSSFPSSISRPLSLPPSLPPSSPPSTVQLWTADSQQTDDQDDEGES